MKIIRRQPRYTVLALAATAAVVLLAVPTSAAPSERGYGLADAAPTPGAGGISLQVKAVITAVRVIVVDDQGTITGIWSNTREIDPAKYALKIRLGGERGPDLAPTKAVMEQYRVLAATLDWSRLGRVY